MNENIETKVKLFRQFLFHYQNWVEAWILEHPADMFKSKATYSAAFQAANQEKFSNMYLEYNLSPDRIFLSENLLKSTENGRKCIEKNR
jgi:hypothetical protein